MVGKSHRPGRMVGLVREGVVHCLSQTSAQPSTQRTRADVVTQRSGSIFRSAEAFSPQLNEQSSNDKNGISFVEPVATSTSEHALMVVDKIRPCQSDTVDARHSMDKVFCVANALDA